MKGFTNAPSGPSFQKYSEDYQSVQDSLTLVNQKIDKINSAFTYNIGSNEWQRDAGSTAYYKIITWSGVTNTDHIIWGINTSSPSFPSNENDQYSIIQNFGYIGIAIAGNGTVLLKCYDDKPSVTIPIVLKRY